jgi:hypothetical protein
MVEAMGPFATRFSCALLGAAALACGLLLPGATARANDAITVQKPSDGATFRRGAEVVFRFTALTESPSVLPKVEVSTTGATNADGSFVHADVVETATATRVAGQANTYQVRSRQPWTRTPADYHWHAVSFWCGDAYNCVVESPARTLTVNPIVVPTLFHSVIVRRQRGAYLAWVWLGVKSTVSGDLVRELPSNKEKLARHLKRRTMLAGRRPLRLATRLEPGRYALYLIARSGSRHKEIRRILVVRA